MKIHWSFVHQAPEAMMPGSTRGLALDVGAKSSLPDVEYFTHHGEAEPDDPGHGKSSTALLLQGIEDLRLESWAARPDPLTIFCHFHPDLDCFASAYLAWAYFQESANGKERLWNREDFKSFRRNLAVLLNEIDRGAICPADADDPETWVNFYTIFLFLDVHLKEKRFGFPDKRAWYLNTMTTEAPRLLRGCSFRWNHDNDVWMAAALCLIHALYRLDPEGRSLRIDQSHLTQLSPLPTRQGGGRAIEPWLRALLEGVVETTRKGVEEARSCLGRGEPLSVRVPELEDPVRGVSLTVSQNVAGTAAKLYRGTIVANMPVRVTAVALDDDPNRVIISVFPGMGMSLKGLGLALHRLNERNGCSPTTAYRYCRERDGKKYPDPLFSHVDPWYDGRDLGFTIVDAARNPQFRRLTPEMVIRVLGDEWRQLAAEYETPEYKHWLMGRIVPFS